MSDTKKIVIALGGNAILQKGDDGSSAKQYERIHTAMDKLKTLITEVPNVVITHGNGPQVGDILLRYELTKDKHPMMPLDVCNAQSQGFIGYMIVEALSDIIKHDKKIPVAMVTRVKVSKDDPDFKDPSKPIGPWYDQNAAKEAKDMGFNVKEIEPGKFRRVVPSPMPVEIMEIDSIKRCLEKDMIVIASGGGGIPVTMNSLNTATEGVEAVIDKDRSGCLLARDIDADIFVILTDVDRVYINYGKPNQKEIADMSVEDARKYLAEGHFAKGSMGPKVDACLEFVEKTGKKAIIASLDNASDILNGAGTHFHK